MISRAILTNPDVTALYSIGHVLRNDFWGTSLSHAGSHKSYRPLVVLWFRLDYALSNANSCWFHLVNVALHLIVCGLFTGLMRRLAGPQIGWLAGLFFSVQPVHVEPVASVVGRADLAVAAFLLATLHCYFRFIEPANDHSPSTLAQRSPTSKLIWLGASVLCAFGALLCKEYGIVALPICAVLHVLYTARRPVQPSPSTMPLSVTRSSFGGSVRPVIGNCVRQTVSKKETFFFSFSFALAFVSPLTARLVLRRTFVQVWLRMSFHMHLNRSLWVAPLQRWSVFKMNDHAGQAKVTFTQRKREGSRTGERSKEERPFVALISFSHPKLFWTWTIPIAFGCHDKFDRVEVVSPYTWRGDHWSFQRCSIVRVPFLLWHQPNPFSCLPSDKPTQWICKLTFDAFR